PHTPRTSTTRDTRADTEHDTTHDSPLGTLNDTETDQQDTTAPDSDTKESKLARLDPTHLTNRAIHTWLNRNKSDHRTAEAIKTGTHKAQNTVRSAASRITNKQPDTRGLILFATAAAAGYYLGAIEQIQDVARQARTEMPVNGYAVL